MRTTKQLLASRWLLLSLCLSTFVLSATTADDVQKSNTALVPQSVQRRRVLAAPTTFFVGKIDGTISSVDSETGNIYWTFDSGSPLITSSRASDSNVQVFPGIDGSVYILEDDRSPKLELSRVTVSELVQNSPSLTADGSIILGSQTSKLFFLNPATGQTVKTVSIDDTTNLDSITQVVEKDLLVFARRNYKVQSLDKKGSARWSCSYAEIHHLDLTALPNPHALVEYLKGSRNLPETSSSAGPLLTMGRDNSLHAKDPQTGWRKWSVSFKSAPVVVYTPENSGRDVLSWDSMPYTASEVESPTTRELWPTRKKRGTNTKVVVGSVSDGKGLYALPAPVSSSSGSFNEELKGIDVGDRKMLELFERKGDGEMDFLRCVLDVENNLTTQSRALPWIPERQPSSNVMTSNNEGMSTTAVIGLTLLAVFVVYASIRSRRGQQVDKLGALHRLRKSKGTGNEDDTGPIPVNCDGSVTVEGIQRRGNELNARTKTVTRNSENENSSTPRRRKNLRPLRVDKEASFIASQKQHYHQQRYQQLYGMYAENGVQQRIPEYSVSERTSVWTENRQSMETIDHSCCPILQRLPSQEEIFAWSSGNDPDQESPSVLGTPDDEYRILGRSLLNEVNEPSAFDHFDQRFGQQPKLCPGGYASTLQKTEDIFDLTPTHAFNASPIHANWGSSRNEQPFVGVNAVCGNSLQHKSYSPHFFNFKYVPGPSSISSFGAMQGSSWTGKSLNSFTNLNPEKFSFSNYKEGTSLKIGQLTVGPKVLGYGTGGTIVFDGEFNGRPVAVKRILKAFYDMAANEKDILILSDEHPNLVRLFAVEEDKDFVFLALERCEMSLCDFIISEEGRVSLLEDGAPSSMNMKIMFDICEGLQALHARGVVHRDLKPHNILMTGNLRAKLSDMGLGRRLVQDQSSFFSVGSGGSSGWQAPEQLIIRQGGAARQTKAMDVFSLGCVMYHCISAGRHPFGESSYTRDDNILKNKPHLDALDDIPEAKDLISKMLEKEPGKRPTIEEVVDHPFFWTSRKKLNFLIELSDRVENEDRQDDKTLFRAFEGMASKATGGNWGARLDPLLVTNLGQYRKYTFTSLRDLLRVVRNKHNHYRELPAGLKQAMGSIPDGFCKYFIMRFPDLLMTTYSFAKEHLSSEIPMDKYFPSILEKRTSNADSLSSPSSMPAIEEEYDVVSGLGSNSEDDIDAVSAESNGESSNPGLRVNTKPLNAVMRTISGDSVLSGGTGTSWDAVLNVIMENANKDNAENEKDKETPYPGRTYSPLRGACSSNEHLTTPQTTGHDASSGVKTPVKSPQYRPHPRGFDSLINTEREPPRLEIDTAKKDPAAADPYRDLQSPIRLSEGSKKYEDPSRPIVGWEEDTDNQNYTLLPFPRRPGTPVCDFYQKTGFCKYHERCRFHHPPECAVHLNEDGLPVRVGEPICEFYKNTHQCKFGGACKFNHPNMKPIYAGSMNHTPRG